MLILVTFLEGMASFISPCTLPLLPLYITYFAGGENSTRRTLFNSFFFVCGFSMLFVLLGVLAGEIGRLLVSYQSTINIISGAVVIIFGLSVLGIIRLPHLLSIDADTRIDGIGSAFIFGIIYAINMTPCIGAFLGSALMLAQSSADRGQGALLLLFYSLGLGIPFLVSALIIDTLKGTFAFIKQHYIIINRVCGALMIILGIALMLGWINRLILIFT